MFQLTLRAARVNGGFTQTEAAKQLGIHRYTLARWENGRVSPSVDQFKALCDLYGCPVDHIFLPSAFTLR